MAVRQGYINHVGLVLDASGSMSRHSSGVIKVADTQMQYLATRSTETDQETRATVYQFDDVVECLFYDKDVLRLPSIGKHYRIGGTTALIDATMQAITDLEKTAVLYGDHAFLLYVLTDGLENASRKHNERVLSQKLAALPNNWTVAVFVPNQQAVFEAKKLGFAPGNIAVWDTTSAKGIEEVGRVIRQTTDSYYAMRSQGIRSTTGLFTLTPENLTPSAVSGMLLPVPDDAFVIKTIAFVEPIREFVEREAGIRYRKGCAFYQLTKPETVQDSKQIAVKNVHDGQVYSGHAARQLLGLPSHTVRVAPASHPDYDIFVQSTSVNRKLVPGTDLLVIKTP